ncbi:MAG: YggS family pyridoxal phosphate-dependent enzyme [Clostridia bacterium]|nr:YggS family pyridoxal phosphate-dependent enzyme [Clostridia bacterium]
MNSDIKKTIAELLDETSKHGVKLIAVTKTVPTEIINEAISCGVTAIGENRVQELLEKYDSLDKRNLEIHLIGRLQTNKVKYIVGKVDLIHSVDSLKLGSAIDKYAKICEKVQNVLVQVNVSGEQTKGGVAPDELEALLVSLSKLKNIKVRGLMCIPPAEKIPGENKRFFSLLNKMMVDNNNKNIDNICMDTLSMGMSGDYRTAIECGATMVRIGTKIFGKRNYTEV